MNNIEDVQLKQLFGMFNSSVSTENPKSYFVVAPPGSGKTGLSVHIEKQSKTIPVRIDPDTIAIYHDEYDRIYEEIPENSYHELQKFIRTVLNDTIRPIACIQQVDIITEGTFGDTNGYVDIIKNQKNMGYDVDINTIVVHRLESLISSFERQQTKIEEGFPPRIINTKHHDRAYKDILETMQTVEDKKLATNISVYLRTEDELNPKLYYRKSKEDNSSMKDIIIELRQNQLQLILNKSDEYQNRIENLRNKIILNKDSSMKEEQLEQLEDLEKDFLELKEKSKVENEIDK